jgi:hypothetical protein
MTLIAIRSNCSGVCNPVLARLGPGGNASPLPVSLELPVDRFVRDCDNQASSLNRR